MEGFIKKYREIMDNFTLFCEIILTNDTQIYRLAQSNYVI